MQRLTHFLLVAFLALAIWQAVQVHELANETRSLGKSVNALQEQHHDTDGFADYLAAAKVNLSTVGHPTGPGAPGASYHQRYMSS